MKTRLLIFVTMAGWLGMGSAVRADDAAGGAVVAKIGSTVLTEDQLKKDMGMSLYNAENQVYQVKRSWIDKQAKNILFDQAAKDAGISRKEWEAKEIDSHVTAPTEDELGKMIQQMSGGQTITDPARLTQVRAQAVQYLTGQKHAQRENEIYQQLTQKQPVVVMLTAPEPPHIDVTYSKDNPVKGPKDAPVTVMEFTDFQCPWCKRSQESVKTMEQSYGDKVKMVDRMFPLTSIHPRAMPSAEAAFCAKEQGKYWEMRDKLFASQTMSDDDFKQYSKDLGLNSKKFDQCMADKKVDTAIQMDIAEGQRYGVQGTPTFFVNGLQASFNQLTDMVKSELDKKKS